MVRRLYVLLHYLALPFVIARMAWRGQRNRGYWDRWGERFGYLPALPPLGEVIWIHAVSVGEVQAAIPLVRALEARGGELRVVITTTTPTGAERVAQTIGDVAIHRYAPYDVPGAVNRFLDAVRPRLVVIMETELWPNILHICAERAIPVLLANMRMSERSAARYRRVASATRAMLARATYVAAQTVEDAERFVSLGADPASVEVTGNTKFDVKLPASLREQAQALRRALGVDRSVWIAGSTHEGEEEQVLDAFARVRRAVPDAVLVLVPRHPERAGSVAALCRRRGLEVFMRTQGVDVPAGIDVFLGDTMGELPLFYAAADVAFVGGSLVNEGGHNMLEPAALGVPVVYGRHVFDFAEIAVRLGEIGAGRQVDSAAELADVVVEYLRDANLRHGAGETGRAFVESNRGALARLLAIIDGLMGR
ncbi:MAG: lipid IV(A) 3-deoxy-D-manno-octulosonic acid transferase [Gammaproteobacteria bacterium]|nr:lipid IV(A) 3-deoxy-D-manno-octulosonic acid transferase [Gammaproteobacteria bacterium]